MENVVARLILSQRFDIIERHYLTGNAGTLRYNKGDAKMATQIQKRKFDFTTWLLVIVLVIAFIGIFVVPVKAPEFDWTDARTSVKLHYNQTQSNCTWTGIEADYTGEAIVLEKQYAYKQNGQTRNYTVNAVSANVLVGSNVRHVRLRDIPKNISPRAFDGVEGVTVYTDQEITEDMKWAKNVTIRSIEEFDKLVNPGTSYRFDFSATRFMTAVKEWAADEKIMLGTLVPLAVVMIVLSFLRQKSGYGNPLWPLFRDGFSKWMFIIFELLIGVVTAITLFCEEADIGMDLYGVTEFMLGWPMKVLLVIAALFLLADLFSKDFPWFAARWVIRITMAVVIICFCAAVGWIAATIVTENLGLFKILYIIALIMLLTIPVSSGSSLESGIKANVNPYTVITESGSSMRVDYYSHGTYVGGDQIVNFSADTFTGASGKIYKKY